MRNRCRFLPTMNGVVFIRLLLSVRRFDFPTHVVPAVRVWSRPCPSAETFGFRADEGSRPIVWLGKPPATAFNVPECAGGEATLRPSQQYKCDVLGFCKTSYRCAEGAGGGRVPGSTIDLHMA